MVAYCYDELDVKLDYILFSQHMLRYVHFVFVFVFVDYGKRAVISRELAAFLTQPGSKCEEIEDLQEFIAQSHPVLPAAACSPATQKEEGPVYNALDSNGNKPQVKATQTQTDEGTKPSQNRTYANSAPATGGRASYSSATIASKAKRMLHLAHAQNKRPHIIKDYDEDPPHNGQTETLQNGHTIVINVSNLSLNRTDTHSKQTGNTALTAPSISSVISQDGSNDSTNMDEQHRKISSYSMDERHLHPAGTGSGGGEFSSIRKSSTLSLDERRDQLPGNHKHDEVFVTALKDFRDTVKNGYLHQNGQSDHRLSHSGVRRTSQDIDPSVPSQRHVQLVLKRVNPIDANLHHNTPRTAR